MWATKNNHFTEMCSGSEAGPYLRLIDSCITQLKAHGPSRTCNEITEEEEETSEDASAPPHNRLQALRATRPHTVGYIGGGDQEQGGV